jgi:O-antigen/teichoic acid export membrane protein
MFGIVGISLFSSEIIRILARTPDLWEAYLLVPFLSIAVFFLNMREVSIYGLIVAKKTSKLSLITIISALVNFLLNIIFIPLWNAMGAALATLISQIFFWLTMHYLAQRSYFIPYENKKITLLFITGILLSFSGMIINDMELITRVLLKCAALAGFPFILYLFNFYEPGEIQVIKGFIVKWSDLHNFRENIRSLKNISDDL